MHRGDPTARIAVEQRRVELDRAGRITGVDLEVRDTRHGLLPLRLDAAANEARYPDVPRSRSLGECANDLRRRHELADVALGMLRGVEEQADHRGWQPRSAHLARLEQCRRIGRTDL